MNCNGYLNFYILIEFRTNLKKLKFKSNNKLTRDFYLGNDVVQLARSVLGKILHTNIGDHYTAGKIVEVEAYCGATDRACHAFPDKRTKRTETMYMQGGTAYVYLVYGMHHLFNIVTNFAGRADAVLVRAIEPIAGLAIMKQRRNLEVGNKLLTGGPGRLTQALGLTISDDKADLLGDNVWLSPGEIVPGSRIIATPRIGVDYAGEDAALPWRFYIRDNKYVSK